VAEPVSVFGNVQRQAWEPIREALGLPEKGRYTNSRTRSPAAPMRASRESAHFLAEDLDELATTRPTSAVRLLPGFDQYLQGPGTADGHFVPATRRARSAESALFR
jgi:hypothetical protein